MMMMMMMMRETRTVVNTFCTANSTSPTDLNRDRPFGYFDDKKIKILFTLLCKSGGEMIAGMPPAGRGNISFNQQE
jgi:hypothetical protein